MAKNPFMSAYLSAANRAANTARGKATSEIKNPDGSIVFRLNGFDVPEQFSQVAADILALKYFCKAGVARRLKRI